MHNYSEHLIAGVEASQNSSAAEVESKTRQTKRKRQSHEANEEIAWTASRCNRLLRTITSRVKILEKLSAKISEVETVTETVEQDALPINPQPDGPRVFGGGLATPSKDLEWLPPVNKKLKTYGSKTRGRSILKDRTGRTSATTKDDAFGFPTPFVKRFMRPNTGAENQQSESDSSASVGNLFENEKHARKSQKLSVKPTSTVDQAHRNLVSAFESLLLATKAEPPSRTGASSLMKSCLNRTPHYIELEEKDHEHEDENERFDVTFDLYSELEDLGHRAGGGWPGLRLIVRAHGLRKIELAIQRGLIPDRVIVNLMQACKKSGAVAESQKIMQASLSQAKSRPAASISALVAYGEKAECDEFLLRELGNCLRDGRILPEAVTERPTIWRSVLKMITSESGRPHVEVFLETLLHAYGVSEPSTSDLRLLSVVKRAVVMMTAMAMTDDESTVATESTSQSIAQSLRRISMSVRFSTGDSNSILRIDDLARPVLMANLLLQIVNLGPTSSVQSIDVESLVPEMSNIKTANLGGSARGFYQPMADFICDVARCLQRVDNMIGNDTLRMIVRGIVQASKSVPDETSEFLKQLARDGATAWADSYEDKDNFEFAEDVDDLIENGDCSAPVKTPMKKLEKYRWEEGLCEWIAMTPMTAAASVSKIAPPLNEPISPEASDRSGSPTLNDIQPHREQISRLTPHSTPITRQPMRLLDPSTLNAKSGKTPQKKGKDLASPESSYDPDQTLVADPDEDELSLEFSAKKPRLSLSKFGQVEQPAKVPTAAISHRPGGLRTSLSSAWDLDNESEDELGM